MSRKLLSALVLGIASATMFSCGDSTGDDDDDDDGAGGAGTTSSGGTSTKTTSTSSGVGSIDSCAEFCTAMTARFPDCVFTSCEEQCESCPACKAKLFAMGECVASAPNSDIMCSGGAFVGGACLAQREAAGNCYLTDDCEEDGMGGGGGN